MSGPLPVPGVVHLADIDPRSTPGVAGKKAAARESDEQADELGDLQERLYAESRQGGVRSVLLVLQAMDTAGKGGIVRHVVGRLDPQGVHLHAFKAPTEEERSHDFLWRVRRQLPGAGIVGVFDRSHYEDVLIARVRALAPLAVIEQRYEAIAAFERAIAEQGTTVLKVMLHLSAEEQRTRLQRRLDRVDKQWKYNPGDVDERARWSDYMAAYEIALTRTSTPESPWFVVPADHTWYARWAVQRILLDALRRLDPQWPRVPFDVVAERARLAAT